MQRPGAVPADRPTLVEVRGVARRPHIVFPVWNIRRLLAEAEVADLRDVAVGPLRMTIFRRLARAGTPGEQRAFGRLRKEPLRHLHAFAQIPDVFIKTHRLIDKQLITRRRAMAETAAVGMMTQRLRMPRKRILDQPGITGDLLAGGDLAVLVEDIPAAERIEGVPLLHAVVALVPHLVIGVPLTLDHNPPRLQTTLNQARRRRPAPERALAETPAAQQRQRIVAPAETAAPIRLHQVRPAHHAPGKPREKRQRLLLVRLGTCQPENVLGELTARSVTRPGIVAQPHAGCTHRLTTCLMTSRGENPLPNDIPILFPAGLDSDGTMDTDTSSGPQKQPPRHPYLGGGRQYRTTNQNRYPSNRAACRAPHVRHPNRHAGHSADRPIVSRFWNDRPGRRVRPWREARRP